MRLLFLLLFFFASCTTSMKKKKVPSEFNAETTTAVDSVSAMDNCDNCETATIKSIASIATVEEEIVGNEKMVIIPIEKKKGLFKKKSKKSKIKKVEIGLLVYNIPDTMQLRKTYIISIRINKDTLDRGIRDNGGIVSNIRVSNKMEVNVIDPSPVDNKAFDIIRNNDNEQKIETNEYTEWVYNITPIRYGRFKLNLIVSLVSDEGNKQVVYFKDITVSAKPVVVIGTFWGKYWQWMLGTLIIPFGVWYINRRKQKGGD